MLRSKSVLDLWYQTSRDSELTISWLRSELEQGHDTGRHLLESYGALIAVAYPDNSNEFTTKTMALDSCMVNSDDATNVITMQLGEEF